VRGRGTTGQRAFAGEKGDREGQKVEKLSGGFGGVVWLGVRKKQGQNGTCNCYAAAMEKSYQKRQVYGGDEVHGHVEGIKILGGNG